MPVSMLICWDFEVCDACSFVSPFVSAPSAMGNAPPSRLIDNEIFVSFVSLLIAAARMRVFVAICSNDMASK